MGRTFKEDRSRAEETRAVYGSPSVVDYYARAEGLDRHEEALFARYLRPGMDIIDIGVGGGRTTPYLASLARNYVGIDYSAAMIAACRRKYPQLRFEVCDASDMGSFVDKSFDAAVFAFNGIDYFGSDATRKRCLAEVARVLVDDGVFIFSSHNAKALVCRPELRTARGWRIGWRIARAMGKSLQLTSRHLRSGVFAAGEGYVWDPHHGGMRSYVSTPATIGPQLIAAGLELVEVLGGTNPGFNMTYLPRWYYYACRRVGRQ